MTVSVPPFASALAVDGVGDPASTRVVYITVVALFVLGVFFVGLGIWLTRRTQPDPELLGPLEEMGSQRWRRRDPATQLRILDEVRPPGAVPLRRAPLAPSVDSEFAEVRSVTSFDDLAVNRLPPEASDDALESGDGPSGLDVPGDRDGVREDAPTDDADASAHTPSSGAIATEFETRIETGIEVDADPDDVVAAERDVPISIPDDTDATVETGRRAVAVSGQDTGSEPVGDVDDGTVEIGRPSAVAHEALLLARSVRGEVVDVGSGPPTLPTAGQDAAGNVAAGSVTTGSVTANGSDESGEAPGDVPSADSTGPEVAVGSDRGPGGPS